VLQIIRNEGIINTILLKLGIVSAPVQILYTGHGDPDRHGLCLSAADVLPIYASMEKLDFGWLKQVRPLRNTLQGAAQDHLSLVKPGRHCWLHPGLHSRPRRLCDGRACLAAART